MSKLVISIVIGAIAGIIDVIPMIMQKLDKTANWSAFVHWIVLGFIISYVDIPVSPWLKGLIIAEAVTIPIMIIVAKDGIKSIIPIIIMTAVLGILVGIATAKWAI
ncbi:MAG TPA: hypothetical protein ENK91_08175 [Bacteroidetes bacterium]|nr:hypothetical protein [Bacteroidota bacterium]